MATAMRKYASVMHMITCRRPDRASDLALLDLLMMVRCCPVACIPYNTEYAQSAVFMLIAWYPCFVSSGENGKLFKQRRPHVCYLALPQHCESLANHFGLMVSESHCDSRDAAALRNIVVSTSRFMVGFHIAILVASELVVKDLPTHVHEHAS